MTTRNMGLIDLTRAYATTDSYPCAIGTIWTDEVTWKDYLFAYNSGSTSWTVRVPVGVFLTGTTRGLCSFTAATQLLLYDGGTAVTAVAGIALGTVATTEAGWIQCGGFNAATETDGNMDASDAYYVADNGIVTLPATEPTHIGYFGVCVTADASTTVCGGWLTNCFWK